MPLRRIFIWLLICAMVVPPPVAFGYGETEPDYYDAVDLYAELDKYNAYLAGKGDAPRPGSAYTIPASSWTDADGMDVVAYRAFENVDDVILTGDDGYITWTVAIEQAGLYNLSVQYYPVKGTSAPIQRSVFINGALPFAEAGMVEFSRIWVDETHDFEVDVQGNMLRPSQQEAPAWQEIPVADSQGYYVEPFLFYFEEGLNTVTLLSIREPMIIGSLSLYQEQRLPGYSDYLASLQARGGRASSGVFQAVSAEKAAAKSDPMLYPYTDRSDPSLTPYSNANLFLNAIGGSNWNKAGQWIEWEFDVTEAGLYHIGFNRLQNAKRGSMVYRKIYINGEVPFEELQQVDFPHRQQWRQETLGGDEPYLFWLDEGRNTLRMEVTLGQMAEFINDMQEIIRNLHAIYRQVAMITGGTPDIYRDYQIAKTLPHLPEAIRDNYARLETLMADLQEVIGSRGDIGAFVNAVLAQMRFMIQDIELAPKYLKPFWDSVAGLQTWIASVTDCPIALDMIYIYSPDTSLPKLRNGFFARLKNELLNLLYSFVINYNSIGNMESVGGQKHITVWLGTGRDQANTLKTLINNDFTPNTGIDVQLMLVQFDSLLPSVFSGQAPDVAMQLGNDIPMNYGMRGALANLAELPGFDEVAQRFYPSAMMPMAYDGRCFGLPETQTFPMLFYRKDILAEIGLSIPETWDDVRSSLLALGDNKMFFGLQPYEAWVYGMFLMQHGGSHYIDNGRASGLDSEEGINAFKEYTSLYTEYGFARRFDFVTRLRTGEMPLGVADYSLYNTLQVSAPELKGLWGFAPVPGVRAPDGTIDRSVPSGGLATVLLEQSADKESAWEFMKWWTSEDVQVRYGMEMEGLMGPAARYATANKDALWRLPWPVQDAKVLNEQLQYVKGVPQVPGGYFTDRNIINMANAVIESKKLEPRDAVLDYVQNINNEIQQKRREFNLD